MRSSRFVTFLIVVALFAVSPSLFARVCHPRQPITCGATTLSHPTAIAPVAKRVVKAAKPHTVVTQQPMISQFVSLQPVATPQPQSTNCAFAYCAGTTLTTSTKPVAAMTPEQLAMCCGPWLPTFPYCAATTLASSKPVPAMTPEQLAMCCGPWLPTFPYCAATTLSSPQPAPAPKPQPDQLAMCCGPWLPTFPYCSATTLG